MRRKIAIIVRNSSSKYLDFVIYISYWVKKNWNGQYFNEINQYSNHQFHNLHCHKLNKND